MFIELSLARREFALRAFFGGVLLGLLGGLRGLGLLGLLGGLGRFWWGGYKFFWGSVTVEGNGAYSRVKGDRSATGDSFSVFFFYSYQNET